jgi:hypothetical protein
VLPACQTREKRPRPICKQATNPDAPGIGCFFDAVRHRIPGIRERRLQSLYHFTVGGAVEAPRLRTEPAYAHRGEA